MIIPEDIYSTIVQLMPIPCVDILARDEQGRVLLIKRANEPAKDQWWFPGGRVHYLETRLQAVIRKLKEECGLDVSDPRELGTYDVILDMPGEAALRHGITTLCQVQVTSRSNFTLDDHGADADWRFPGDWLMEDLHFFVRQSLRVFAQPVDESKEA